MRWLLLLHYYVHLGSEKLRNIIYAKVIKVISGQLRFEPRQSSFKHSAALPLANNLFYL